MLVDNVWKYKNAQLVLSVWNNKIVQRIKYFNNVTIISHMGCKIQRWLAALNIMMT